MEQHPNARLTPRGRERLGFFGSMGVRVERVMTDNGPAYRSGESDELLGGLGIRHKHTRPFSPWQNGKVERMNQMLAREWQYARAWESEGARARALAPFIDHYNWDRPHGACGGLPPMSCIVGVNNALGTQQPRLGSWSASSLPSASVPNMPGAMPSST